MVMLGQQNGPVGTCLGQIGLTAGVGQLKGLEAISAPNLYVKYVLATL